ncbi:hypothetical protein DENSPDRAFT_841252 [Dentipellis sp. KUC8613]|nr:hypothetical protein DENSPDRAFT_841252 [Dentipellis sp. KUC8613]
MSAEACTRAVTSTCFATSAQTAPNPYPDRMLASLSSLNVPPSIPRSRLPSAMDVHVAHSSSPPSHVLAIFTSPNSKHPASDTALLLPTHHIVLAANCSLLPRLPISRPQARANGTAALPVIPLTVPTAEAFAPLHAFLVSHRLDRFVCALLPVPPAMLSSARPGGSSPANPLSHVSKPQLATYLATASKGDRMSALMGLTRTVSAVWRNACALGVFDRDMWAALDLAWEVILGAMNMVATGQV